MGTNKSLKPTRTKGSQKFEPGYHAVGDDLFDDSPEQYWGRIKVEQNHENFCTIDVPPQFQCNCKRYGGPKSTNKPPPPPPNDDIEIHDYFIKTTSGQNYPTADKAKAADMNNIQIPLTELRLALVKLQNDGVKKIGLTNLLTLVHDVYHKSKGEEDG